MNVKTLPRTVLAFEYSVIRRPISLVETHLIARLDAESPGRLGVERTLGHVDALAGRWLGDSDLVARGERSQAHADAVTKAQTLHRKAQLSQAKADATLARETKAAAKERISAAREHQGDVTAATTQEAERKVAADKRARARADAEKAVIAKQAQAKITAAENTARAQSAAATTKLKLATVEPKAELAKARDIAAEAAEQRADADRLAHLAETEKQSRQN